MASRGYLGILAVFAAFAPVASAHATEPRRIVRAEVVALDQMLVYNRFGSFNPFGMIYALKRDVVDARTAGHGRPSLADCGDRAGSEPPSAAPTPSLSGSDLKNFQGNVRLRNCKRPRPLTLRANVGDVLEVEFTNLLLSQPNLSDDFCKQNKVPGFPTTEVRSATADAACRSEGVHKLMDVEGQDAENEGADTDWPKTRWASLVLTGLRLEKPEQMTASERDKCLGLVSVRGGETITCRWIVDQEGPHFITSVAAGSGGEGDGGSLTHGLFGAMIAEPKGSTWFRSQLTRWEFDNAWTPATAGAPPHARKSELDYDAKEKDGTPILKFTRDTAAGVEIVHSDLNAIIVPTAESKRPAFREFTVVFHDELKTFFTNNFQELDDFEQLHGVRDGFGINYGASGMGSLLIANRKKIGPAPDCVECLYEEFFLQSWANGDPALLEWFPDDPSNVHHSYLNDPVVFRNFHAGPKETHVFHLHAHQWFGGNDRNRGSYLDSQTVGPMQGFTYNIYGGGSDNHTANGSEAEAWLNGGGSGNRGRTPGDSIFHCHLYPHFAQGMWELWRVHDVLEDGSRKLPDGQSTAGLSLTSNPGKPRPGTLVALKTGANGFDEAAGTPVPAIVPLPDRASPLLPTYDGAKPGFPGYPFYVEGEPGHRSPQAPFDLAKRVLPNPAGSTGAQKGDEGLDSTYLDGGLPRHIIVGGERTFTADPDGKAAGDPKKLLARSLALADFGAHYEKLDLKLLDYEGSAKERAGIGFHHDGKRHGDGAELELRDAQGGAVQANDGVAGYKSFLPSSSTTEKRFHVNGAPPKPGAPFADPCGVAHNLKGKQYRGYAQDGTSSTKAFAETPDWFVGGVKGPPFLADPGMSGFRRYQASAIELKLVVNRAGWHDPQARINVLSNLAAGMKGQTRADAEPFFFRALSGECIEFRHRNELPKELARDDFQVRTPTDTIGQHIHLVKFDVLAADGSGNGWNYEDGTFAPDEVAERVCVGMQAPGSAPVPLQEHGRCGSHDGKKVVAKKDIYRENAEQNAQWFQTTVQRWFADPILSPGGEDGYGKAGPQFDRTMRTVFTHDHFGPSSIQQHGFYSALVIEPAGKSVCEATKSTPNEATACDTKIDNKVGPYHVADADDGVMVGTRKLVIEQGGKTEDKIHPDYREFMLSIADFALLYDPKGGVKLEDKRGLACLVKEAEWAQKRKGDPHDVCRTEDEGSPGPARDAFELTKVPAVAAKLDGSDMSALKAASTLVRAQNGKPVAAPRRPEAISTDHHDPYLVNYRNEPLPLRVGTHDQKGGRPWFTNISCGSSAMVEAAAVDASVEHSVKYQRSGEAGDFSNAFRSTVARDGKTAFSALLVAMHGDPCTPLIESYSGENVQVRLIQGAQEVQHNFTMEGFRFRRNPDQKFATGAAPLDRTTDMVGDPTYWSWCRDAAKGGLPTEYENWRRGKTPTVQGSYWDRYETLGARCDNLNGLMTSQEIGISEHFEFAGPAWTAGSSSTRSLVPGAKFQTPDDVKSDGGLLVESEELAGDYLYHFGSQDALWNGAWGLFRVNRGRDQDVDFTSCLMSPATLESCAEGRLVGHRLRSIEEARNDLAKITSKDPGARSARSAANVPLISVDNICPKGAPRVRATVTAVQLRDVGVDATDGSIRKIDGEWRAIYGPGKSSETNGSLTLYDPNALALVQTDLGNAPQASDGSYARGPVLAAVRASLKNGLRPLTLRINAGDCLELTTLNALRSDGDDWRGLSDESGDAPMPPITPLNVDGAADRTDVRPSAWLALSIPLTQASHMRLGPAPVGVNPTGAIAPSRWGTSARVHSATISYYAGLIWPNEDALFKAIPGAIQLDGREFKDVKITPIRGVADVTWAPGAGSFVAFVFGKPFYIEFPNIDLASQCRAWRRLTTAPLSSDCSAALKEDEDLPDAGDRIADFRAEIATRIDEAIPHSPYAFGPTPMKAISDVIGQPSHGLVGMIVVEPEDARYPSRVSGGAGPINLASSSWQETIDLAQTIAGAEWKNPPPCTSYREGALVIQDGLNLWAQINGDGSSRRAIKDCHVCDDSYDFGEKAVSYRSEPHWARLGLGWSDKDSAGKGPWGAADLNAQVFPTNFLTSSYAPIATPTLTASVGEEVVYRVIHPGGRARQHSFATFGAAYDDLFPGFGFPSAALLGPGKSVTAAFNRPATLGCHLWLDGPGMMFGGGVWGQLDVGDTCKVAGQ